MERNELAVRELEQISDPLSFVVMEQILKASTEERSVAFKPSSILGGGFDDWRRSRKVKKDVNAILDDMWVSLVRRVATAHLDLVEWQARAYQRELEFAEQLRNQWKHFEKIEKPRAIFYHELEMEKIREMNKGGDPAWTVNRTLDSFDAVNARLQQIARTKDLSGPERHQQAQLLIESIKSSLQR